MSINCGKIAATYNIITKNERKSNKIRLFW